VRVWNFVVRRTQDVIELSLKAALRSIGLQVPHRHDVGILLVENRKKLPVTFDEGLRLSRSDSFGRCSLWRNQLFVNSKPSMIY
jgi:HEPN domain-containing protein